MFFEMYLREKIGNDTILPFPSTVFQMKENKVVLLQQRAPVMKGYASEFVSNLISWVKQSAFKEIVLLFSADAALRNDKQLMQLYTQTQTHLIH
jgi:predicted ATP-grasp superfamily ATP-dependent carboligase